MPPKNERAILKLLAERIKLLREKNDISQEELAFLCEIDRTYISKIERGIANPSLLVLQKIAQALDTSLIKMFDF